MMEDLFKEEESVHDLCHIRHIKILLPKDQKHTMGRIFQNGLSI
jgi:hypothetical protein